ncbi:MAG: PLP-dependent aminotransferase family protein, partial [Anaerolineales bacterium]|nr:PLP-dependent aminotransferase family protein [Anaerolineales bacterium]
MRYYSRMVKYRITQIDPAPGQIDLGIGQPGFDLLPLDLLRRAAAQRLQEEGTEWLSYGYEQGDGRFRQALSRLLSRAYHFSVSPADLMVTNGASQGLDLICTLFTQPGNTIFVEEPTYFLALRLFADHGLRVVSIPTTDAGLDVDVLEAALRQHRPVLLYTIPTFQNPSGATMPQAARERLLALSERYGFHIIADEVYQLLRYTAAPPPPLAQFIASERVFSLGSFSKMLAPGLRLGWIQAAPRLLARLTGSGLLDSGG